MKKAISLLFLISSTLSAQTLPFQLKAKVFDDGQKITAIELDTKGMSFNPKQLTPATFKVQVKSKLPIDPQQNKVFGLIDDDRPIGKAFVNPKGNIELQFATDKAANTLAYIGGDIARNVKLDLDYQITLQAVGFLPKNTTFQQTGIFDSEVDRFQAKTSQTGLAYQLFQPQNLSQKRPLILWLHGNGEGGTGEYRNNQSQLLANRGAVAFTTANAQKIFGGAYVIAPQAPDTWYHNYQKDYLTQLNKLIEEVNKKYPIDRDRIYLFGASAGGYMGMRMLIEYPHLFAGANLSAPALDKAPLAGGKATETAELQKIEHIPLWLVHSANDPTISYPATSKRVYLALRENGAILTAYPSVEVGKKRYNGHWSWIYSLRNQPINPQGEHLFQWMAKQRLINNQ